MRSFCLAAWLLLQQPATGTHAVRISVFDPTGVELPARVFLHSWSTLDASDRLLQTDSHGRLTLHLPNGYYDLCFAVSGFTPSCREVRLNDRDATIRLVLKVSKLNPADFE